MVFCPSCRGASTMPVRTRTSTSGVSERDRIGQICDLRGVGPVEPEPVKFLPASTCSEMPIHWSKLRCFGMLHWSRLTHIFILRPLDTLSPPPTPFHPYCTPPRPHPTWTLSGQSDPGCMICRGQAPPKRFYTTPTKKPRVGWVTASKRFQNSFA